MAAPLETLDIWAQIAPLAATRSIRDLSARFGVPAGQIAEAIKRSALARTPVTEALPPEPEAPPKAAPPRQGRQKGKKAVPLRSPSKVEPFRHLLGVQTDAAIAELAGVVPETVRVYRVRAGISATAQPAPDAGPAAKVDRPRKHRAANRASDAQPARRGVPSPIDAHVALLGTMSDGDLATRVGVTRGAISQYRRRRNIAPFQTAQQPESPRAKVEKKPPAPRAAAPATARSPAPRSAWAYIVRVKTGDSERSLVVIGHDVSEAAARAVRAVQGEIVAIERYLESLEAPT